MAVPTVNSSSAPSDASDRTIDLGESTRANFVGAARNEREQPLAPGRILLDRYVLTQVLDAGGACTVFRARDLDAPRAGRAFVAVKAPTLVGPRTSASESAIHVAARLERQYERTKRLSHICIAETFELQRDGDLCFFTMELIDGHSLAEHLRSYAGILPPALPRRILKQIADALFYAHSVGVAHGRLSPANVFVLPGDRIKLLGFGNTDGMPAASSLAYASPQVLEGSPASIKDDSFSFTCMAYEIIAGHHPFGHRTSLEARASDLRPTPPPCLSEEQSAAPDRPRARPDPPASVVAPHVSERGEKLWLILIAACVAAMIAAVIATRMG
jgi:serine/threonine protein kinase